jgi:hypothetical protein
MERTLLVDDLDGRMDEVQKRTFAVDGTVYDIDLADDNMERLREALALFIAKGRPRTRPVSHEAGPRHSQPAHIDKGQRDYIREWAKRHIKYPVADRGKIPDEVMDAFQRWAQSPSRDREREREELVTPEFGGRSIFSDAGLPR